MPFTGVTEVPAAPKNIPDRPTMDPTNSNSNSNSGSTSIKGRGRHTSRLSRSLAILLPTALRSQSHKEKENNKEPKMEQQQQQMESEAISRDQTQSKLPTYRKVDVLQHQREQQQQHATSGTSPKHSPSPSTSALSPPKSQPKPAQPSLGLSANVSAHQPASAKLEGTSETIIPSNSPPKKHSRNFSTSSLATRDRDAKGKVQSSLLVYQETPPNPNQQQPPTPGLSRNHTFPTSSRPTATLIQSANTAPSDPRHSLEKSSLAQQKPKSIDVLDHPAAKHTKETRRVYPAEVLTPARNNKYNNGPPLSMITQGYYDGQALDADSTTNWVAQQSLSITPNESKQPQPNPTSQKASPSVTAVSDNTPARPLIKPIRAFKPSSRKSTEMSSRRTSRDPDETIRTPEDLEDTLSPRNSNSHQHQQQTEQDELTMSDESDLFLSAAREEEKAERMIDSGPFSPGRADSRFSRVSQRASLPPSSVIFSPVTSRRRGSDQEGLNGSTRPMDEQNSVAQALTYNKDRPTPPEDMTKNRYSSNNSQSNPTTPRTFYSRERSPESIVSYNSRRINQEPAQVHQPPRTSYRQSNLSYSTPRTYNSSPLVSRSTDMHEAPETPRAADGTESSVSTTAPSLVWDELDDMKSRILRLEAERNLAQNSGATVSRASNDRPPTATTTVTTISSSPKRGREHSISQDAPADVGSAEVHPLLNAALTKTKGILSPEVYKALEAVTADALAIASMMGTSGQPGPISSSQSTIGGIATVSDRQVRRKADSMCRNLTEFCLAISESHSESPTPVANSSSKTLVVRPANTIKNDYRRSLETPPKPRQIGTSDLIRAKASPRALSRLEERRSSLLSPSALPSPRYTPSEVGVTPPSGRRSSMFLRSRRAGTEEPEEEDDDTRFRAPSRATTDLGRLRNSPREYTSQQPLPDRLSPAQSSLPVRRHYTSTSLTNTIPAATPPISSLGGRRYLERATPERDSASILGRMAEDRELRKPSITQSYLGRTGSLTRKSRQSTPVE